MDAKGPAALILFVALVIAVGTVPAFADWDVGDPCVYSQLPDSHGWDVYSEWRYGAADDWTATETLKVTDIHFWGSWKNDAVGDMGNLLIQIYDNDTSGNFPKPGNQLWEHVVLEGDYTSRLYTTGTQGWYDPRQTDDWDSHNHQKMFQYNMTFDPEDDAFQQEAGQTYWLEISSNYEGCQWGWKTSVDNDNGSTAVFWDKYGYHGGHEGWYWQQLYEPARWAHEECIPPREPEPMGMSFVITPEPTTLLLFAMGAAAVLRRRSR